MFWGGTRVDWVPARLRALGRAYKGSSSLSTFSAANSCLMVLDDCGATIRRMALTCVWSWARFRGVYGGVLVVKRLGNLDSRDVSCFRASYMGKFSWADMVLGMLDANIYI